MGSQIIFEVGEIVCGKKVSWIDQRPDGSRMFGMPYDSGLDVLIEMEDKDGPSTNTDEFVLVEETGWIQRAEDGTVIFAGSYKPGKFSLVTTARD